MSDSGITDSKLSASKFGTAGDGGGGGGFGHCDMPCPGFAAASAAAGRDCDGNILSGGKNGSRRSRSKGGRHGDRSRSQSGSSDRSKKRTKKNDGLSIGLENTACIKKAIELDSGGKTIKCTYDPCKFDCYDFYYCDPMMNICQRQNFSCDCYSNIQDFISDDSRMCPTPERNCTMFCSDDCNRSSLFNNCNNCNYPGF
ncbi:PREDICTED: uncharacterized protein LOC108562420 [Nicrophorus vespilloides]|uniref:Uncharacterized protein LOC108562420 n=1 Tax=Nicrophorus vespilloides TaxID=110193 RepID=A0ABM1MNT1_NICVS|nr:PREDICTED: uncharacterized protein LOC108562420 [Nicrophorus vespilloides]